MEIVIPGLSSMSFDWRDDGFGVPCDRCGAENACNRNSGNLPPGTAGYFCDACDKIVAREGSEYYKQKLEESTRELKSTVLFRPGGTWTDDEIERLTRVIKEGDAVWWDKKEFPEYLVINGHYNREITKALKGSPPYTATCVVGNDRTQVPFLPV